MLADTARSATSSTEWYSLAIDGQRVGFAYRESETKPTGTVDRSVLRIEVSQLHQRSHLERSVTVSRDPRDRLQQITAHFTVGINSGGWTGKASEDGRSLLVTVDGDKIPKRILLSANVVLPDRLEHELLPVARRAANGSALDYLDDFQAAVVKVDIQRLAPEAELMHLTTSAATLTGAHRQDFWIDARGSVVRSEQALFGTKVIWTRCASACDRAVESPYDPMSRWVVESPFRIPRSALQGRIRYVFLRTDGGALEMPSTGEQSVSHDGARAVVTVCAKCSQPSAADESELRRYSWPNAWVQSNHPQIRGFAEHLRKPSGSVDTNMRRLVTAVRERMTGQASYLGYATSLDALRSGAGDCTEFAVLLAALARAEGIPARIAVGLAYSPRFSGKPDVFSPHAWVQVRDGDRWVSYDAALESFDATHIALAIGTGDPQEFESVFGMLQTLRIEKAGSIRP